MKPRRQHARVHFILVAMATLLGLGVFFGLAHAIIGRPLTPMSYAGVARRTTRRAVYAGAATASVAAAAYPYPQYYW
jgi:hypothetical protein